MYKCRIKILNKFVEKLQKYRKMFKDIITFLGLDYRDALLITLFFVVLVISITKIKQIGKLYHIKICCLKSGSWKENEVAGFVVFSQ